MFTIADARRVQRDLGLGSVHVYYVSEDGFVLAHTDAERAAGAVLEDCPAHRSLCSGIELLLEHGPGWWSWQTGILKGLAL